MLVWPKQHLLSKKHPNAVSGWPDLRVPIGSFAAKDLRFLIWVSGIRAAEVEERNYFTPGKVSQPFGYKKFSRR